MLIYIVHPVGYFHSYITMHGFMNVKFIIVVSTVKKMMDQSIINNRKLVLLEDAINWISDLCLCLHGDDTMAVSTRWHPSGGRGGHYRYT